MPHRRVALLTNRSLFAAGVQELLQSVNNLTLSVIDATDSGAMDEIARLRPHVIVLDTNDALAGRAAVVQLLEQQPHARVVTLNLDHAAVDVYQMKHVIATDVAGLLRAINGPAARLRGDPAARG